MIVLFTDVWWLTPGKAISHGHAGHGCSATYNVAHFWHSWALQPLGLTGFRDVDASGSSSEQLFSAPVSCWKSLCVCCLRYHTAAQLSLYHGVPNNLQRRHCRICDDYRGDLGWRRNVVVIAFASINVVNQHRLQCPLAEKGMTRKGRGGGEGKRKDSPMSEV